LAQVRRIDTVSQGARSTNKGQTFGRSLVLVALVASAFAAFGCAAFFPIGSSGRSILVVLGLALLIATIVGAFVLSFDGDGYI
jgi:hypothetical protein